MCNCPSVRRTCAGKLQEPEQRDKEREVLVVLEVVRQPAIPARRNPRPGIWWIRWAPLDKLWPSKPLGAAQQPEAPGLLDHRPARELGRLAMLLGSASSLRSHAPLACSLGMLPSGPRGLHGLGCS